MAWRDPNNCQSGLNFESALLDIDYVCLNDSSSTHFDFSHNSQSVTDLSLIHSSLGLVTS